MSYDLYTLYLVALFAMSLRCVVGDDVSYLLCLHCRRDDRNRSRSRHRGRIRFIDLEDNCIQLVGFSFNGNARGSGDWNCARAARRVDRLL